MPIRGSLLAVLVAALAIPAAARADTALGITAQPTGSTAHPCPTSPSQLLFESSSGGTLGGALSVPSSSAPQVVTHWAINANGVSANQQLTLVAMRFNFTTGSPRILVVGTDTETLTPPASAAGEIESFTLSHPITVQSGDLIGQYAPGATPGLSCYWSGATGETSYADGLPETSAPTTGEQLIPAPAGVVSPNSDLNLAATISPLSYDAALSLTAGPANAIAGQPALVTATVTNDGPVTGPVMFTDQVQSGLSVDYAGASGGTCITSKSAVTCTLSDIGAGRSGKVAIVVTPVSARSYSDSAFVSLPGDGVDPNPLNNSATATLKASAPGARTRCVVPKLGGASVALATRVLPLFGCKVGKVKKAVSKTVPKGDVISTNPRAGSYAPGRRVTMTVSSGKPKRKRHKK